MTTQMTSLESVRISPASLMSELSQSLDSREVVVGETKTQANSSISTDELENDVEDIHVLVLLRVVQVWPFDNADKQ